MKNKSIKDKKIKGTKKTKVKFIFKKCISKFFIVAIPFLIGVIFSEPVKLGLSKFFIFYFLDNNSPIIANIEPDIRTIKNKNIGKNVKNIKIIYFDKGSGLDLKNCKITPSYKSNQNYEPLKGKILPKEEKNSTSLSFIFNDELRYGEYCFDILLTDKAGNQTHPDSMLFTVREDKEIISTSIKPYKYEDYPFRRLFRSYLERANNKSQVFDAPTMKSWIYTLTIRNISDRVVIKNFDFEIDTKSLIYCLEEEGSLRVKGIKCSELMQSYYQKTFGDFPPGYGTNWKFVSIDRIEPKGFIIFSFLIGDLKDQIFENMKQGIDIYAHYTYEGYGMEENLTFKQNIQITNFNLN